jgi:hypothetical protein
MQRASPCEYPPIWRQSWLAGLALRLAPIWSICAASASYHAVPRDGYWLHSARNQRPAESASRFTVCAGGSRSRVTAMSPDAPTPAWPAARSSFSAVAAQFGEDRARPRKSALKTREAAHLSTIPARRSEPRKRHGSQVY